MEYKHESTNEFLRIYANNIDNKDRAGFIRASPSNCCIDILDVERNYRGLGIGTHLLRQMERKMKEAGCNTVNVKVGRSDSFTDPPFSFYEKNGYKHSHPWWKRVVWPFLNWEMYKNLE